MKISYNWLKWYIEGELPAPEKLADILTFKLCEVEGIEKLPDGDSVLDLNILPNRAHDLLSHHGVAREVAGLLGFGFKDPTPLYKQPTELKPTNLKISLETDKCRRYMGRIIRNVKVGPSPEWVVKHLESIGQRSINNIVDATNIVMFDCGNPCHAFDLAKVGESLVVKELNKDMDFPVLGRDQVVAKLKIGDMVIGSATEVFALAGIKGGLDSGVSDTTTDIVLEVANFDPVAVRKTARRLNLLSDSAKRFENELSATHAVFAMQELTATILEMCPEAQFEEIVDIYPKQEQERSITFSVAKINKYLGTSLSSDEMVKILTDYGYQISGVGDICTLSVPALRLDLTGPHDIAEEVARLYGLENITPVAVPLETAPIVEPVFAKILAVKSHLVSLGYREVMTYAFRKKGVFEVIRGVGDKGALRNDLTAGLAEAYELNRLNAPLLEMNEMKIFEVGAVFPKTGEVIRVACADKKGVTEMTLDEYISKNNIDVADSYDGTLLVSSAENRFEQWSQYPFITRDIAVWVPETVTQEELEGFYASFGTELLAKKPYLFDQFSKDGKTSYAFRLVFQAADRTLNEGNVGPIMEQITAAITQKGWQIR